MASDHRRPKEKICASCGRRFVCGPQDGRASCWCEDLPHALPFTGDDCACPDCARAQIERLAKAREEKLAGREGVALFWSGGKDGALALDRLAAGGRYRVAALVTSVVEGEDRVGMHGVRTELIRAQALRLGLPLRLMPIARDCPDSLYEKRLGECLEELRAEGVRTAAFGDIFLEDLRRWRDERLAKAGFLGLYPLWGQDTAALAREFVSRRFRAVLSCVDTRALDASFAGRELDEKLLRELPASADPCGERGEYHTLVYAGPIFPRPLRVRLGGAFARDGRFQYRDIVPA